MEDFEIEHIGYLTGNIEEAAKAFTVLGYQAEEIVADDTQKTFICFLRKDGAVNVELVMPYEDNRTMQKMLKKQGNGPYHMCYLCDDVDTLYDQLSAEDWLPLFKPVAAPAFNNRKICYFFRQEIGFVEFINKK